MTRDEFINKELLAMFNRMKLLSSTKGQEYAGSDDVLANFRAEAKDLNLQMETIIGVYMSKHHRAIRSYIHHIEHGHTPGISEPITGRIDDALLYLSLLRVAVVERQDEDAAIAPRIG